MSEHICVRYKKLMNIFSSFSLSLYGIFKFILLFNHFDLLIYISKTIGVNLVIVSTPVDFTFLNYFVCRKIGV